MARYKEFKRLLKENGFVIKKGAGKGSHEVWEHPSGVRTTLPDILMIYPSMLKEVF